MNLDFYAQSELYLTMNSVPLIPFPLHPITTQGYCDGQCCAVLKCLAITKEKTFGTLQFVIEIYMCVFVCIHGLIYTLWQLCVHFDLTY